MKKIDLVSVHGGHSGQFCEHATDSLEEIVKAYIEQGFTWVGITEHTPAMSMSLLDPGQKKSGLTPEHLFQQFAAYIKECRRLQQKYSDEITLFTAMEIETYSGYLEFVPMLMAKFQPDYIVGSVHFVDDIIFDYSKELYQAAVDAAGGIEQLYLRYFDLQYTMIDNLSPSVVGHFDLIRIFDPEYKSRLLRKEILQRVIRNLELIKKRDLILDLNLRALVKGADEPYPTQSILDLALEMEIAIVPGDDSHGKSSVGAYIQQGIEIINDMGFSTAWRQPTLIAYEDHGQV